MPNYEQVLERHLAKQGINIVVKDIDQVDEQEYIMARMDWLGASDSSKLLNVNPFPDGKFENLVEEKILKVSNPLINKKAVVRMGKDLEPMIIDKINKFLETKDIFMHIYKPVNMYGDTITHLGCNFDGILFSDTEILMPIEIKTVSKYGRKYYDFTKSTYYQQEGEWQTRPELEEPDYSPEEYENIAHYYGIPVYYYTQLQQQLKLLNKPYGILGVLDVENWDIHLFKIPSNKFLWNELTKAAYLAWMQIDTARKIKKA